MKFSYTQSGVPNAEIHASTAKLAPHLVHLRAVRKSGEYNDPESSLCLPADSEMLRRILAVVREKVTPELKYVLVIGIGGSLLGTRAVYHALRGHGDALEPDRFPKMIFVDTTDPQYLEKLTGFLAHRIHAPHEILVHIASKSGTTTETVASAELVLTELQRTIEAYRERVIIATDAGSPLEDAARANNIAYLSVPKRVGGRFSVMSPIGLAPLAASGIDIRALLAGADRMVRACIASPLKSPAALSAATIAYHMREGKHIHDTFLFGNALEHLGTWYRQLLAESIGKEINARGEKIHAGITPTVSLGPADLHSTAQLTLGGPRDKVTTFVTVRRSPEHVRLPRTATLVMPPHIKGKRLADIHRALYASTVATYTAHGLPFLEVILDEISEDAVGAFLQWKMIEVMNLAHLLEINAFDEPNVQDYKERVRQTLSG